ncbi:MAG: hypothetical protein HC896_04310 [Bacteroidales bacterium]|nr:hypothetical protein [Bacteroidales bacterium]
MHGCVYHDPLYYFYLRNINCTYETEIFNYNQELNNSIKELKSAQQHLVQSEKMASLGVLMAGVAHELNNPLNFINGGLNIIDDLKDEMTFANDDTRERCNMATSMLFDGIERAKKIVRALMNFAYPGNNTLVYANLQEIIENSLLFLKEKLGQDIIVSKNYAKDNNCKVYPDKMHQVF